MGKSEKHKSRGKKQSLSRPRPGHIVLLMIKYTITLSTIDIPADNQGNRVRG